LAAEAHHVAGPLEQFSIEPLVPLHIGRYDLSFSNSALLMVAAAALVTLLMTLSVRRGALVPGRLQSIAELIYEFVDGMVRDNAGKEARGFTPFVFTLFTFILLGNLLGMIPYSFTFTSHIIVTFALALTVFLMVTILGIVLHGFHFFSYFAPKGVPVVMLLLLVPIEIVSYMIRPATLSIRLFANMMAGHTMLFIFASFVTALGIFGVLPLVFNMGFILLELLVAVLQAYVYTILTCIYLHDAIHLH